VKDNRKETLPLKAEAGMATAVAVDCTAAAAAAAAVDCTAAAAAAGILLAVGTVGGVLHFLYPAPFPQHRSPASLLLPLPPLLLPLLLPRVPTTRPTSEEE